MFRDIHMCRDMHMCRDIHMCRDNHMCRDIHMCRDNHMCRKLCSDIDTVESDSSESDFAVSMTTWSQNVFCIF